MNTPGQNHPIEAPFRLRIPARVKVAEIVRLPDHAGAVELYLEQGAEAVVSAVVSSSRMDIVLEQGARLEILRVASAVDGGDALSCLNVRQAGDSALTSFFFTLGGNGLKDDIHVSLEGEGAEVFLNGLQLLAGNAAADSHTFVDHMAPHATSDQLYKNILRGKSHAAFYGKIMVRREAQLTNSYQLNKTLLLSPDARMDTRPELEIFADDVKCSHGAAIGQLDDDQMFYLQTRGIDRAAAGEMLIEGFVEDVLGRIKHPLLRAQVEQALKERGHV